MVERIKESGGRLAVVSAATVGLMFTGLFLAGPASATPDPVATAFDDMEAKVVLYGAAIVALVVLAVGIFLGIKYLRKGVAKA